MTPAPTPSEDAPTWARPLLEQQIVMLGELAEDGLALARAVKAQALPDDGAAEPAVLEGLTRAHVRMARSVRLSLMLQARLIADLIAFDKGVVRDRTRKAKDRVGRIIARIAAAQHDDPDEIERLAYETVERLDSEDLYGEVLDRPVSELVAMICKDLGLDPDWSGLAREAWAVEEAASGPVGWPLATVRADRSSGAAIQTNQRSPPSPSRGEGPGMGVSAEEVGEERERHCRSFT